MFKKVQFFKCTRNQMKANWLNAEQILNFYYKPIYKTRPIRNKSNQIKSIKNCTDDSGEITIHWHKCIQRNHYETLTNQLFTYFIIEHKVIPKYFEVDALKFMNVFWLMRSNFNATTLMLHPVRCSVKLLMVTLDRNEKNK